MRDERMHYDGVPITATFHIGEEHVFDKAAAVATADVYLGRAGLVARLDPDWTPGGWHVAEYAPPRWQFWRRKLRRELLKLDDLLSPTPHGDLRGISHVTYWAGDRLLDTQPLGIPANLMANDSLTMNLPPLAIVAFGAIVTIGPPKEDAALREANTVEVARQWCERRASRS